jgi:hypothetical protein
MKVSVEAAKAPAMMGPQLTAVAEDSSEADRSIADTVGCIDASYRTNSMMRMMIGIGIPSNQSKIPRPMKASLRNRDRWFHNVLRRLPFRRAMK